MRTRTRWEAASLLAISTLLLAGCGNSSSAGQSTTGLSAGTSTGGSAKVRLATTSAGKVLVDPNGMTMYAFAKDTLGHSNCTGSCASYWPPVPGSTATHTASGLTARFGTIKRSDGSSQLTVDGYPMYTYAGDSAAGQANGQGQNLSGGVWWVVAGDGSWVKGTGGSSSGGRAGY